MTLLTIDDVVTLFSEIDTNSLKKVVRSAKKADYRAVREGLVSYILDRLPDREANRHTDATKALQELMKGDPYYGTERFEVTTALKVFGILPKTNMDNDATKFCASIRITLLYVISPEDVSKRLTQLLAKLYGSDKALGIIAVGAHSFSEIGKSLLNAEPTGTLLLSDIVRNSGDNSPEGEGVKFTRDTYTRLLKVVMPQNQ